MGENPHLKDMGKRVKDELTVQIPINLFPCLKS